MTLHSTAEFLKKAGIVSSIGLGVIIIGVIFFRIGIVVKNILFPPSIAPANQAYGKIPYLEFPQSTIDTDFTYTVDTLTGTLPELPDRLVIYPLVNNPPNLLNLEAVKQKVVALGLVDKTGNILPEVPLGGPSYVWTELTGIERKVVFDIVSLNFTLTSEYLGSNTVLRATRLGNEDLAIQTVQEFLTAIQSLPEDITIERTKAPDPEIKYATTPQLFSIGNNELIPTTSLSSTQVIRVDLYQKDIEYKLTAGKDEDLEAFEDFEMKMPILYPRPPYSTMNFLVASGVSAPEVVSAIYNHQSINLESKPEAEETPTYPIKTAQQAFEELQSGNGYVAAYSGADSQILVNKVYLAYYIGETVQEYLMPVIVFEGPNGFFAYVSAVEDQALE
ncbi:MAG: hypothetical protein H0W89_06590 [Candidatus Levybacteria bacterium]|nr:hypothetical protein [Candidatus Levybacteria bacterium]